MSVRSLTAALLFALALKLGADDVLPSFLMPQNAVSGATLRLSVVQLTNVMVFGYQSAPTDNGTGSFTLTGSNYTGPAWAFEMDGLTESNAAWIEVSTNLQEWHGFPSDGCYLTLYTNMAGTATCSQATAFFRARVLAHGHY